MPESLRAFCRMVSLTAANTNRMFVVSVAWVRLQGSAVELKRMKVVNLLRIKVKVCAVHLIETPE